MSKVYIVRHGESVWNLEHRLQGGQDPALSEVGYRQAARVAEALEGLGVAAVYSSPLRRALNHVAYSVRAGGSQRGGVAFLAA